MRTAALLLMLLLSFAGCSAGSRRPDADTTTPPALAAPSALDHAASFAPGVRYLYGSQYEGALPSSRITVDGVTLKLEASAAPTALDDYAYALWMVDMSTYSGPSLLGVDWEGGVTPAGTYVSIANWTTNQWDWRAAPATPETEIGPYSDYVSSNGRMIIAVASASSATATLERVYFGLPPLAAPLNVMATDSAFPDKVVVSWDPPAGAAPDSYSVWRTDQQPPAYAQIGTSAALTFEDTTAVPDTVYWYAVKSSKAGYDDSAFSASDSGVSGNGGIGWTISVASTVTPVLDPQSISLAEVSSNPAVVYNRNAVGYGIHYVRAQDTVGGSWGGTQLLQPSGQETQLRFIGGRPGISYTDGAGGTDIMYRHGTNPMGITFDPAVTVDDLAGAHPLSDADLLEVGGVPAVAFKHADFELSTGTELCFMRAVDALGDTWPMNRVVIDSGDVAWNPQLGLLTNGSPAIVYGQTDQFNAMPATVEFVRATDITGASWQPEVMLLALSTAGSIPQVQLINANGRPAVFIYDPANKTLYYKRASDALGSLWPDGAMTLDTGVTFYDGAATVNDFPAVVYLTNLDKTLVYRQAIDLEGNSWFPPDVVESNEAGMGIPTLAAFGTPQHACVAYRINRVEPNAGEVKFARKD
jgi:hypothetical protein